MVSHETGKDGSAGDGMERGRGKGLSPGWYQTDVHSWLPVLPYVGGWNFRGQSYQTEGKLWQAFLVISCICSSVSLCKPFSDKLPVEWISGLDEHTVRMEKLDPRSAEYRRVTGRITITGNPVTIKAVRFPVVLLYSVNVVLQVERVENVSLYKKWLAEFEKVKKEMQSSGTGTPANNFLYHGTQQAPNILKICSEGFNRSFAGINGIFHTVFLE